MRIVGVLMALLMLPIMVTRGQDESHQQAPIIALWQNTLYSVSADDGSATVLAEMPSGQRFFPRQGYDRLSPDGAHLVYATENDPESPDYKVSLFVLDVASGQSEVFEPKGGVFDVPAHDGYHFVVGSPTWSVDGKRLYYLRLAVDNVGYGKLSEIQLAYLDVTTHTHLLVARLDPKQRVFDVWGVKDGIIVRLLTTLGQPEPLLFYGLDGRLVSRNVIENLYPYPVAFKGEDYYAIGSKYGLIASLVNVVTGEEIPLDATQDNYYPSARSRIGGNRSMLIYRSIGSSGSVYRIFASDQMTYLAVVQEVSGVRYSFAPDGQALAYVQLGTDLSGTIRIVTPDGSTRELPFTANEIYWGAPEYVAFNAPPLG